MKHSDEVQLTVVVKLGDKVCIRAPSGEEYDGVVKRYLGMIVVEEEERDEPGLGKLTRRLAISEGPMGTCRVLRWEPAT